MRATMYDRERLDAAVLTAQQALTVANEGISLTRQHMNDCNARADRNDGAARESRAQTTAQLATINSKVEQLNGKIDSVTNSMTNKLSGTGRWVTTLVISGLSTGFLLSLGVIGYLVAHHGLDEAASTQNQVQTQVMQLMLEQLKQQKVTAHGVR